MRNYAGDTVVVDTLKEALKPLREAMEQMAKAQELEPVPVASKKPASEKQARMEIIKKAAVFSKER